MRLRFSVSLIGLLIACGVLAAAASLAAGANRSVTIPQLQGQSVARSYTVLRGDDLTVTIPHGFVINSLQGGGLITATSPPAGRSVAAGSTVSLRIGCAGCGSGSPSVPRHLPAYRVPDFLGEPLAAVARWIGAKTLYLTERFGPLRAATASRFGANYRVTRQAPAAGTLLRLGVGRRTGPNSGSFRPTPLTVGLTQHR